MYINLKVLSIVISCPIWGIVFFSYLDKMFERKYNSRIIYVITEVVFSVLMMIFNFTGLPMLKSLYGFLSVSIISAVLYIQKEKAFLIYNTLFVLFLVVLDILSVLIFTLFSTFDYQVLIDNDFFMLVTGIPLWCFALAISSTLVNILKKQKISKVSILENVYIICKVIFEIGIITYITHFKEVAGNNKTLIIIIMGVLLSNFFQLYLFRFSSLYRELNRKVSLSEQQINMMVHYYEEIEEKYKHSRKIIHDLQAHIDVMNSLFCNNRDDGLFEQYKSSIQNKLNDLEYHFSYKNKILNLIINENYHVCKSNNIKFNVDISDISIDFIDNYDVTTIFANLLLNAIEACKDIEDISRRSIDVLVYEVNQFIIINIINTCSRLPVKINGKFTTTKRGHFGVGLSNVAEVVKKYDGEIKITYNENKFDVRIVIQE